MKWTLSALMSQNKNAHVSVGGLYKVTTGKILIDHISAKEEGKSQDGD